MQIMSLLVYDNDNLTRAKGMAQAFLRLGICSRIIYQGSLIDAQGNDAEAPCTRWDLVLLHKSNQNAFDQAVINADNILTFTGDGSGNIPDYLPDDAVAHICHVLGDTSIPVLDKKEAILTFWRCEPRIAFRLLCEAWEIVNIDKSPDCEGFTIHAPVTPEDWLRPFDKKPSDPNAIEDVLAMMGSVEIKAKAERVLKSVGGEEIDLRNAVLEFLAETANPPS